MTSSRTVGPLAHPFSPPPKELIAYAGMLDVHRFGTEQQKKKIPSAERIARPWLPQTMDGSVLEAALLWWDDVAEWINANYHWQIQGTRLIPPCWPEHPHIVHELALLAWQRYLAGASLETSPLEDWHRFALPSFLNRLTERLGTSCRTGHEVWPGKPEDHRYRGEKEVEARTVAFEALLNHMSIQEPEQLGLPVE